MKNVLSPSAIQIDASAHCQLACPSCPTASGATKAAMGAGHLDPGDFETLLDANPQIREVELSNYGEMFLNPRLRDLLRIAFERDVLVHANNGTNLNHASPETLEALVTYRMGLLSVSIDGASAESYARYRVKGDFERVMENIRCINAFKRKHRSGFPVLTWQFIVFGHNEHEIEEAKMKAAELGMAFRPKISWDDGVSPVRDPKLVQIRTGLPATRADYHRETGRDYSRGICYQLWNWPVFNWDGRIMGCCRNFWGEFGGNAFGDGLSAALRKSKLTAAQDALMGRVEMDAAAPCATCDLYLTLQRDGKWLTREEIERAAGKRSVLTSITFDAGESPATHVDVFVAPGNQADRLLLARPPASQRVDLGQSFSAMFRLGPGEYVIYALPRQLDPEFRKHYPAPPPVTMAIDLSDRPAAREFCVRL